MVLVRRGGWRNWAGGTKNASAGAPKNYEKKKLRKVTGARAPHPLASEFVRIVGRRAERYTGSIASSCADRTVPSLWG